MKTEQIDVPYFEGYKCVGYQYPCYGQYYLFDGELLFSEIAPDNAWLVYEKLLPKRYIFEETGEERQVTTGEYYISEYYGGVCVWELDEPSRHKHTVLKLIDE